MLRIPVRLIFLLIALSAAPAAAQTARNVSRQEFEPVRVKFLDGNQELRGRFLELKAESVAVLIAGRRVELPLAEVRRIDVGRDSVANGALIGGLIGGLWCAFICGQGLDNANQLPMAIGMLATVGASIGAGIDAAHVNGRTIYPPPSPRRGSRVVRPAIHLTVRF